MFTTDRPRSQQTTFVHRAGRGKVCKAKWFGLLASTLQYTLRRGPLSTWSVTNGSVMNGSVMNIVCYESGLFSTGLL